MNVYSGNICTPFCPSVSLNRQNSLMGTRPIIVEPIVDTEIQVD